MSDTIKKIAALAAEADVTDDQLVAALRAAFGTKAPKESPVFTGTGSIPNLKVTDNLKGATGTFTGVLKAANPAADTDLVTLAYLKALQWLTDGAIAGNKLANNAVTAAKIANNAVTAAKIAANAVDSSKIKNGSIAFADLAAAAIATQAQAIAGTAANLLLTPQAAKAMIDNALSGQTDSGVPSGVMVPFAGKTVPDGWLLCNGASLAKASYPDLFNAIGYTWGGNGNTFYLPNYNGRHILGTTYANNVGSTVSAGLPDITGYTEVRGIENQSNRISTGVFSVQTAANDGYSSHKPTEPNTIPGRLVFSASDSDSTYGRSYGVSVAAAYVLMIIKE